MLQLFLAACLVVCASGCCMPDVWEGQMTMTIGTFNKTKKSGSYIEGLVKLSYDVTSKILSEEMSLSVDDNPIHQNMVMDFSQGIMFVIRNGTCDKYHLGDMPPNCFPDDDSSAMNYGLGTNGVNARGYRFQGNDSTVYMSVEADNCVPIASETITNLPGLYRIQLLTFFNVSNSIADRQVFNVPTACAQAGPIRSEVDGLNFGRKRSALFI